MRYKAPDGTALAGAAQKDTGIWPVYWNDGDDAGDAEYTDDGPEPDWSSVAYAGAWVYVDENGEEWLQHHLIAESVEPLSDEAIGAAMAETGFRKRVWLLEKVRETYENDAPGWGDFDSLAKRESAAAHSMRERFRELKGDAADA